MRVKTERHRNRKWIYVAIALIIGLWLLRFTNQDRPTNGRLEVFGDVALDGKNLAAGLISCTPIRDTEGLAAGGRITDGRYRIASDVGPIPGEYEIRITTGEPGPPGGGNRGPAPKGPPETSVQYFSPAV